VFGLRRAFQIAGARALIMSLWPVEDEATRAWMREL
jgi:CHAT domain-containing protein